jgi:ribosomal protein S12 methylthiotransferase accessory factor
MPVFLAIRPTSKSLVVSTGKGLDRESAMIGALMESIEVWHAENLAIPAIRGTAMSLRNEGRAVIDIHSLPSEVGGYPSPSAEITWVEGYNLRSGQAVLVPRESVSMDFTEPYEVGLARNSNGLASGATFTEAAMHGLCEVIERDAEAHWRSSSVSRRTDLSTVDDRACLVLLQLLDRAGLSVAVWDVTSSVGIPCFGAVVLADPNAEVWTAIGAHDGFCCHPSSAVALFGAIAEAVQKRLTYISGSRDDISREELKRAVSPELHAAVWDEVRKEQPELTFTDIPSCTTSTPEGDLKVVLDMLLDSGFDQPIAIDLEGAHRVPVVKIIIPGMAADSHQEA